MYLDLKKYKDARHITISFLNDVVVDHMEEHDTLPDYIVMTKSQYKEFCNIVTGDRFPTAFRSIPIRLSVGKKDKPTEEKPLTDIAKVKEAVSEIINPKVK